MQIDNITVVMPDMLAKLILRRLEADAAYAPDPEFTHLLALIRLTRRAMALSGVA